MAARTHLGERERLTHGDAQLFTHEIDPRDHLRDRVFHLETGVHLKEVDVTGGIEQKLDGAGVLVSGSLGDTQCCLAHGLALFVRECRRR